MTLSGWRAWPNALRHLPQHLCYEDVYILGSEAGDEEVVLMREVLPMLLNRDLFPTICRVFVETGSYSLADLLFSLVPRSNITALSSDTPDMSLGETLPLAVEGVLAIGRLYHFSCTVSHHPVRIVEAIASNAPGLEDVQICVYIAHGQPHSQIIRDIVRALGSPNSGHQLDVLRVGVFAASDMPMVLFSASLSARLWSLVRIPRLSEFAIFGDFTCVLAPGHISMLRQRMTSGAPPLDLLAIGPIEITVSDSVNGTMAALERIASALAELSPTTVLRLVSEPGNDGAVDLSGFVTSTIVQVEHVTTAQ